jgi:hypothetical protein
MKQVKYTTNRKYRDLVDEEDEGIKPVRSVLLNRKKTIWKKIKNFFKK